VGVGNGVLVGAGIFVGVGIRVGVGVDVGVRIFLVIGVGERAILGAGDNF